VVYPVDTSEILSLLLGEFVKRAEEAKVDRTLATASEKPLQGRSVFGANHPKRYLVPTGEAQRPFVFVLIILLVCLWTHNNERYPQQPWLTRASFTGEQFVAALIDQLPRGVFSEIRSFRYTGFSETGPRVTPTRAAPLPNRPPKPHRLGPRPTPRRSRSGYALLRSQIRP
jgi:hypothetical protein